MSKKVVLAYSGGLDTSYCAMYLSRELGMEVHGVTVNTGSFNKDELKHIESRAMTLGLASYKAIEKTEDYYAQGVRYLLFGNVLKNNTYPLSVSAERVFQAMAIAEHANAMGADALAHGSTGAGNDQVRFDMIFHILCPEMEIITPIRDLSLSREQEINYLKENGVDEDFTKSVYSINQGLWGTSVGGKETLTSDQFLPEQAFPNQLTKQGIEEVEIEFEKGEPATLNGEKMSAVDLITALDALANQYAIGRDIHVGDTIIGIKGRVGFTAAASLILIKAHHLLEKHVLSKNQLLVKESMAGIYGNLMHEGQFLDASMRDIEAYLESTQKYVSGKVKVLLAPYRFQVIGVASPHDLMTTADGKYGEESKAWAGQDVKGFAKIFGNQTRIFHKLHHGE